MSGINLHCQKFKFFSATVWDGLKLLSIIAPPLMHFNMEFDPTGGVSLKNLSECLAIPDVLAVGSTWIATKQILAYKNRRNITQNCDKLLRLLPW